MRQRLTPLPLVVLLAAGCGSTVMSSGDPLATGAGGGVSVAGDGLTAPAAPDDALEAPGAAGGGSTTDGGVGGSSGAVGTAPGTTPGGSSGAVGPDGAAAGAAPGTGGGSPADGTSGPGVTSKEIYIGLVTQVNGEALNSAAGADGITTGDAEANTRAIIDDINNKGGIGGRKLVPVYAKFDSTSSQTVDQQWAGICAKFTQDKPRVFAVEGAGVESYRACIHKAGVVMLSASLPTVNAEEMARYPGFFEQGYPNIDRLSAFHVQPLVEQKYFTPWNTTTGSPAPGGEVKVGILTYSDRTFSGAVDKYIVPALKRLGYEPQVARISRVNTASDYSSQAAAVKSAQLSFATNGVTHVIPFEANAGLSLFFLANARSQGYYPRYGISSASGFQVLLDAGATSAQQVRGTVGFGWIPGLDLPASYIKEDGPYVNDNARYCLKVLRERGISYSDANAASVALANCASLYLLDTVVDKTPKVVNRDTFVRVVESLGRSYQAAGSLGQGFAPGRHDPSDRAYHWRFFDDCSCFHYDGPIRTVP
jgi:hypothetical protein